MITHLLVEVATEHLGGLAGHGINLDANLKIMNNNEIMISWTIVSIN